MYAIKKLYLPTHAVHIRMVKNQDIRVHGYIINDSLSISVNLFFNANIKRTDFKQ